MIGLGCTKYISGTTIVVPDIGIDQVFTSVIVCTIQSSRMRMTVERPLHRSRS